MRPTELFSLDGEDFVLRERWAEMRRSGINQVPTLKGKAIEIEQLKDFILIDKPFKEVTKKEDENDLRSEKTTRDVSIKDLNSNKKTKQAVKIFFSYSRKDKEHRESLDNHLAPLWQSGTIERWYDGEIEAGQDFDAVIVNKLKTSDVILLMISSDYIASDYCQKEIRIALEQEKAGKARVIPIIVRDCLWKEYDFKSNNALPERGQPITDAKWNSQDDAYLNIAEGIKKVAETIYSKK